MQIKNKVYLIGVFDLFHVGHLRLLEKAAVLGELRVGVVCDEAVKRVKGSNKPIICENQRIEIIRSIKCVDSAHIIPDFAFPKDELNNNNIILVGEDQDHLTNKDKITYYQRFNVERTFGISTSDIIKKIKEES